MTKSRSPVLPPTLLMALLILLSSCGEDAVGPDPRIYAEEEFSFKLGVKEFESLTLSGINGNIEIVGVAEADSFTVSGERRVGSITLEDAQDGLDLIEVVVTDLGTELELRTLQPTLSDGRDYIVHYELIVPADQMLDLGVANGAIAVVGMEASLSISAANGDLSAGVTLPSAGIVEMSTANGTIALYIPPTTSAHLEATLANGTIETCGLEFTDEDRRPHSLTGTLGSGDGTIDLGTANGSIAISACGLPGQ